MRKCRTQPECAGRRAGNSPGYQYQWGNLQRNTAIKGMPARQPQSPPRQTDMRDFAQRSIGFTMAMVGGSVKNINSCTRSQLRNSTNYALTINMCSCFSHVWQYEFQSVYVVVCSKLSKYKKGSLKSALLPHNVTFRIDDKQGKKCLQLSSLRNSLPACMCANLRSVFLVPFRRISLIVCALTFPFMQIFYFRMKGGGCQAARGRHGHMVWI